MVYFTNKKGGMGMYRDTIGYKDAFDIGDKGIGGHPSVLYIQAKSNCLNYEYCSKLDIVTDICRENGNKVLRCNQGQFANIQMLNKLVKNK
jgi:hypothetical protein